MKVVFRVLLAAALLMPVGIHTLAQSMAASKPKVATKAGHKKGGKGKRARLISYYESVMGRKLTEAQKAQLRNAAATREAAQKKFRSDVARLFGTTPEAMATRERAYRKAHPDKPKS